MTETINNLEKKKGLIPTKMNLQNFMSYKDSSIDFGDLTVINSTKNGEGKTALLEAIQYALTGQTLRTMDGLKMENIIRWGASRSIITLEGFQKDSTTSPTKSMFLKRTRKKKGTKTELRIDGEPISDAKSYLQDEIDPKSFSKITYIDGDNILAFFKGTPKERGILLDRLFGIDIIQSVKDQLSTRSLEKEILKIDQEITEIEKKKVLIERSRLLLGEMLDMERTKETLETKILNLNKELDAELEKEQRAKEIVNKRKENDGKIKGIESKLEVHRSALENIEVEILGEESKRERLTERLESLLERVGDGGIETIIEKKKTEQNEIIRIIQTEEIIPSVINFLYESIEDIGVGNCPVCGKQCKLDDIESQREKISTLYEEHKEQLNFINGEIMQLSGLKKRIEKVSIKKDAADDIIRRLRIEKSKKDKEIARLEAIIESSEDEIDITDDEYDESVAILEDKKSSTLKGQLEEITRELSAVTNKLHDAITSTESGTADMEIPETTELENKKVRIEALIHKFDAYKKILIESLKDIRERTLEKINRIINEFLGFFEQSVLNKITMKVTRKIYRGKPRYQYDIQIHDISGREIPFESLSTGQKSSAMLSLIMSINDISTNALPLILFDEIQTCGLDSDSILTVISMIATIAEVKNIIITSRDDDIVKDIQREVSRTVEGEDRLVHNISTKIYTCKLINTESGIPQTQISEYS